MNTVQEREIAIDQKIDEINEDTVILPYEKRGEYFVDDIGKVYNRSAYCAVKRMFDIIMSLIAIIVLAVPMIIIAIAIKITSDGTVLYKQERLGLDGKPFMIVKFRTMDMDAEASGARWSAGDDDPRIFPLGRFLRKTRLDELPQLWNILKGELSIVGPRPERECFYKEFETYIHGFSNRLKVKPGLTGLAQVNGGYDLKPEEKIVFDMEYIRERSVLMDLGIILKTVGVVVFGRGAK